MKFAIISDLLTIISADGMHYKTFKAFVCIFKTAIIQGLYNAL